MTAFLADLSVPGPFSDPAHVSDAPPAAGTRVAATELSAAVLRGAIVVDIRPQAVRASEGTLPGALAIEPAVLAQRLDPAAPARLALAVDMEVEWVLVSSDGSTSAPAASALAGLGLRRVVDVAGGYRALRAEGGVDAVSSAQHLRREAQAISAH